MTMDIHTVTLHQDNLTLPDGADEFDFSQVHLEHVIEKGFSNSDLDLALPMVFRNYGVREIVDGTPTSRAAYIESENGYFIALEDMMLHINITYSRWD